QWSGGAIGPATDQFAFCVALWEAVYGERPFAGTAAAELRDAILDGRRRPPPRSTQVPAWLEAILVRGLAHKADARWPAMTAVIAETERRPTRRRALAAATAAAAATATLATAGIATLATRSEELCPAPTERVAALWGPDAQAAIRTHLLALDPV